MGIWISKIPVLSYLSGAGSYFARSHKLLVDPDENRKTDKTISSLITLSSQEPIITMKEKSEESQVTADDIGNIVLVQEEQFLESQAEHLGTNTGNLIYDAEYLPAEQHTNKMEDFLAIHESRVPTFSSSFAYGLVVGQLSVIIVIIAFIRFFIFADPPPNRKDYQSHIRQQRQAKVLPDTSATSTAILEKTYYDVTSHPSESLDWFSVLVAQAISQIRDDARTNDNLLKSLDRILNSEQVPDFIDKIKVTELNIGEDFPIFSNCRILKSPSDPEDECLEAQIDVDLTDTITLGIETKLLLNFPKSLFAVLPVSLSVSIVRFSGSLRVSLKSGTNKPKPNGESYTNDTESANSPTFITFAFSPDYNLEFSVSSLVGARSKLQDVPKIGQVVEARLRNWFSDRCVLPRYQQIRLPSLWPRSKTTKDQSSAGVSPGKSSQFRSSSRPPPKDQDANGITTVTQESSSVTA